ncbi:MAG: acetyl-CoA carboxylase biotin carboxyl carrier protein [Gammaproteobacteria bacterium]|nr:acetyl-CoA carboxylase biotin carboxyl carrier protein [Gammaproteobacteria bacterium]MDH3447856.1 acetyl-CoA carboxylase biotin carboxyl carrier protein [Gammaproteobacteria bacterium]
MPLSYKEVAEILKIIDASSCEEVVLELENTRLVVRRGGAADASRDLPPKTESIAPTLEKQARSSSSTTVAKASTPGSDANSITVRSPMTGTFYCRPSPDAAAFVKEGEKVASGDTLCLIEVMKLYTTIEATADGIVESILAEDGKLVEFDQPLFVIRQHES